MKKKMCFSKQGDIRFDSDVTAGVMAQEEEVVTGPVPTVDVKANVRGDMIPLATEAPGKKHSSVKILYRSTDPLMGKQVRLAVRQSVCDLVLIDSS